MKAVQYLVFLLGLWLALSAWAFGLSGTVMLSNVIGGLAVAVLTVTQITRH